MASSLAVSGRLTTVTISGWPFSENIIGEHEIVEWESMPIKRTDINASFYRSNPYPSTIAGRINPIVFNWTMNYIPFAYDIYKAACDGTYDIEALASYPVKARLLTFQLTSSPNVNDNHGVVDFSGYLGSVSPKYPLDDKVVFTAKIMVDGYFEHTSITI